jgi:DNA-binding transcriptional MerR regulator
MDFQVYYRSGVVRNLLGMKADNFNVWVKKGYLVPTERRLNGNLWWDFEAIVKAYTVKSVATHIGLPPAEAAKTLRALHPRTSTFKNVYAESMVLSIDVKQMRERVTKLIEEL